ncbi:hypothetical protein DPMN_092003 [Dreissena polymorpha]|uniref:Uncharacterized protein n=1 Tax=Dreissena polymorpha TaxID=45954 RepID=A0A9D4R187_DREPO|nr:hypothetical protein DPMN_092003 [Dreissena polymorpha]
MATPKSLEKDAMDVAVVRWSGGNQTADSFAGAANGTDPPNPIRSAPQFDSLQ